jgi:hypothetical protein
MKWEAPVAGDHVKVALEPDSVLPGAGLVIADELAPYRAAEKQQISEETRHARQQRAFSHPMSCCTCAKFS